MNYKDVGIAERPNVTVRETQKPPRKSKDCPAETGTIEGKAVFYRSSNHERNEATDRSGEKG